MPPAVAVALGGACGALARYGAGQLVATLLQTAAPWSTWTVNLLGCLCIGLSVPLFGRLSGAETVRLALIAGFLGSFTTFSTFSLDTVALWAEGRGLLALLNVVGSVVAGLGCVAMGRALGEWLL